MSLGLSSAGEPATEDMIWCSVTFMEDCAGRGTLRISKWELWARNTSMYPVMSTYNNKMCKPTCSSLH